MRALGLDPGLTRCGIGVVDSRPGRAVGLIAVDTVRTASSEPIDARIVTIADAIDAWLDRYQPDVLAVEQVFVQRNISNVLGTAQVMGIAILSAARHGVPVATHTPTEVKAAVTGSGRAPKAQVQRMVAKLLGLKEAPQPADAADALAVAICQLWRPGGRTATSRPAPGDLTAAQRAWMEAERSARRRR